MSKHLPKKINGFLHNAFGFPERILIAQVANVDQKGMPWQTIPTNLRGRRQSGFDFFNSGRLKKVDSTLRKSDDFALSIARRRKGPVAKPLSLPTIDERI
jgi:hypothetical protein